MRMLLIVGVPTRSMWMYVGWHGGATRGHLENVEGFPDSWMERALCCHEGDFEEVYANYGCATDNDGSHDDNKNGIAGDAQQQKPLLIEKEEEEVLKVQHSYDNIDSTTGSPHTTSPTSSLLLPLNHNFVYLTSDSPHTLTTLSDNTTSSSGASSIIIISNLPHYIVPRTFMHGCHN